MKEHLYSVYMMSNKRNGTLYTGMTSDLVRRVFEHKTGAKEGFSKEYGTHRLVWYEHFGDARDAIHREKCIKEWKRAWKLELIEAMNPSWRDLYEELVISSD